MRALSMPAKIRPARMGLPVKPRAHWSTKLKPPMRIKDIVRGVVIEFIIIPKRVFSIR